MATVYGEYVSVEFAPGEDMIKLYPGDDGFEEVAEKIRAYRSQLTEKITDPKRRRLAELGKKIAVIRLYKDDRRPRYDTVDCCTETQEEFDARMRCYAGEAQRELSAEYYRKQREEQLVTA